jgi:CheY-like chemotaxis protein
MQVFAVKDDFHALAMLIWARARLGYQVLTSSDGEAALKVRVMDSIRLLVNGWLLPGLNGLNLCPCLKARTPLEEIQCPVMEAEVDNSPKNAIHLQETWLRPRLAQCMLRLAAQGRQWHAEAARPAESVLILCREVANV